MDGVWVFNTENSANNKTVTLQAAAPNPDIDSIVGSPVKLYESDLIQTQHLGEIYEYDNSYPQIGFSLVNGQEFMILFRLNKSMNPSHCTLGSLHSRLFKLSRCTLGSLHSRLNARSTLCRLSVYSMICGTGNQKYAP